MTQKQQGRGLLGNTNNYKKNSGGGNGNITGSGFLYLQKHIDDKYQQVPEGHLETSREVWESHRMCVNTSPFLLQLQALEVTPVLQQQGRCGYMEVMAEDIGEVSGYRQVKCETTVAPCTTEEAGMRGLRGLIVYKLKAKRKIKRGGTETKQRAQQWPLDIHPYTPRSHQSRNPQYFHYMCTNG